ncbi:CheY-like chemotaxis protein [Tamilnaduibacter salinus]|uniref:CheY-like chemotaxis protein n=1 Tax=Tamilnaduibacter salinus TaxID=1484056 RepID=A0A2U1CT39_9GAMM|nr:tetratricopeptide repeat protein [Tamilnaduibacter salinus]PVY69601.1 CheY-like chemotaxis protein [Tamilnaduibacter salinus]
MTQTRDNDHWLAGELARLRFLVVDDFDHFRRSMCQMLLSMGATRIETVATASSALRMCTYDVFDVVLCDFNLGEDRNGQHILEELRYKALLRRTALFIMVTAETSRDRVMGAREYQPDGYLTKPINHSVLHQRLGALIRQRSTLLPINREIDLENYPRAISLCRERLQSEPRYRTWLLKTMADLYLRLGDDRHARKIYQDVLDKRDVPWARLGLGRVLLSEGYLQEAIACFRHLVRNQPDTMEAYDLLATALVAANQPREAQRTLQRAVAVSPHAILRWRQLAELANRNQDLETACEAWQQAVTQGTLSIHDHPDHYLGLARSLSDLAGTDTTADGQKRAEDAIQMVRTLSERFPDAFTSRLQAQLVESRTHAGQGRTDEASRCLNEVIQRLDLTQVDAPTGLEVARTYYATGQPDKATPLLHDLAQRYEDDPDQIEAIEQLLDEPVDFAQRMKARRDNRKGIDAFEQGDLSAAVNAFRSALAMVPQHTALNLNLIQVLLSRQADTPLDDADLAECWRCLQALEGLPSQHRQYRRYLTLRRKVEALTHAHDSPD